MIHVTWRHDAHLPEITVLKLGQPVLIHSIVTMHVTDNKDSVWCGFMLQSQDNTPSFDQTLFGTIHATQTPCTCKSGKAVAANDRARLCKMARLEHVGAKDAHWVVRRPRGNTIRGVRRG